MDWRNSGWLVDSDELNPLQRERHEAAFAALDAHQQFGAPYLLFLRTFRIRQLYCHASDGGDGGEGILLEEHFRREMAKVGGFVLRVQDIGDPEVAMADSVFLDTVPALAVKPETWLDAVRELVASAHMIVSECQFLSDGVRAELQVCRELSRVNRTVLILPSHPFTFIGYDDEFKSFPRVIPQFDLNLGSPAHTFVFADLIQGPQNDRAVAAGMLELASRYAREKNPNAALYYGLRAVVVHQIAGDRQAEAECHLAMAQLCREAGNLKLAVVEIDYAIETINNAGLTEQLLPAAREARYKVLGDLFESLMTAEGAEELWRLAKSQGAHALKHRDRPGLAQCQSWMAVAALLSQNHEAAIETAADAINVARTCNDVYRQGFASYYLGAAYQSLGQWKEASKAFQDAVSLLPLDRMGRIYGAAMLALATSLEHLDVSRRVSADIVEVYESAKTIADGLGCDDLSAEAAAGIQRLAASLRGRGRAEASTVFGRRPVPTKR